MNPSSFRKLSDDGALTAVQNGSSVVLGSVYWMQCLEMTTGAQRWKLEYGDDQLLLSKKALFAYEDAVISSFTETTAEELVVLRVSVASGATLWQTALRSDSTQSFVRFAAERLFVFCTFDKHYRVYKLDPENGRVISEVELEVSVYDLLISADGVYALTHLGLFDLEQPQRALITGDFRKGRLDDTQFTLLARDALVQFTPGTEETTIKLPISSPLLEIIGISPAEVVLFEVEAKTALRVNVVAGAVEMIDLGQYGFCRARMRGETLGIVSYDSDRHESRFQTFDFASMRVIADETMPDAELTSILVFDALTVLASPTDVYVSNGV